jgi:hypothetical protein
MVTPQKGQQNEGVRVSAQHPVDFRVIEDNAIASAEPVFAFDLLVPRFRSDCQNLFIS